jgi:hypothetical protein
MKYRKERNKNRIKIKKEMILVRSDKGTITTKQRKKKKE